MKQINPRFTFSPSALPLILKAFGKGLNENNFIIDLETGEQEYTPEGEAIHKDNFGGLKKGSILFLKQDLLTAIKIKNQKY